MLKLIFISLWFHSYRFTMYILAQPTSWCGRLIVSRFTDLQCIYLHNPQIYLTNAKQSFWQKET
jgi:hypothetical protein